MLLGIGFDGSPLFSGGEGVYPVMVELGLGHFLKLYSVHVLAFRFSQATNLCNPMNLTRFRPIKLPDI